MAGIAECQECQGTSWIEVSTPRGPAAKRCDCFYEEQRKARFQAMGLPRRFKDASFDSFSAGDYRKEQVRYHTLTAAMRTAKSFVDDFPTTQKKGLLFHGGSPKDKTHLAVATLKCLVDKGFSGMYCEYGQLLVTLRARSDPNAAISGPSRETARRVANVDVLLLDGLGDHRPTAWTLDTAGAIIKHRYLNEKCLLATTGHPLELPTSAEPRQRGAAQGIRSDILAERIGQETVSRLDDHCASISMGASEAGAAAPFRTDTPLQRRSARR